MAILRVIDDKMRFVSHVRVRIPAWTSIVHGVSWPTFKHFWRSNRDSLVANQRLMDWQQEAATRAGE